MKDLPAVCPWLILLKPCERREHHLQKDLDVQPSLPRKNAFSSSNFSSFPAPLATPVAGGIYMTAMQLWGPSRAVSITAVHRNGWDCKRKIISKCIERCIKMFLHQSSNQGHLHTLANTQLFEFTWQPQFNVQMKELGESQAKSTQISARWRRDLAGWGLHPLEKINWE